MIILRLAAAALVLPLAVAASAEPATGGEVAKPAKAEGGSTANKVVCKRFEAPLGTRVGSRKICKTQQEWDMMENDMFDALDSVQRKPFSSR